MATANTGNANFGKVEALISWYAEKGLDMSTPEDRGSLNIQEALTFGTGNDASDELWHDRRIVDASQTDQLDLAGVLKNYAGDTITFAKVHAILIHNRSDETLTTGDHGVAHTASAAVIEVLPSAANGALLLKAASDTIILAAGDWFVLFSKAGKTITADTGDLLDIIETAALEAAYDIVILGEAA